MRGSISVQCVLPFTLLESLSEGLRVPWRRNAAVCVLSEKDSHNREKKNKESPQIYLRPIRPLLQKTVHHKHLIIQHFRHFPPGPAFCLYTISSFR